MNYEQKYNEVLQKAKEEYNRLGELGNESMKRRFEIIFPELAESEDERIRKEIISIVKEYGRICEKEGDPCCTIGDCLAYLEKQKEQKPAEWSEEDEKRYISCLQRLGTGNPEQSETINSKWFKEHCCSSIKPEEWSAEDGINLNDAIKYVQNYGETSSYEYARLRTEEIVEWLKALRPKRVDVSDQTLQLLICYLYGCHDVAKMDWEKADCRRYISYLEDLDYTLKNRWKPSEEQMEVPKGVPPIESIQK